MHNTFELKSCSTHADQSMLTLYMCKRTLFSESVAKPLIAVNHRRLH